MVGGTASDEVGAGTVLGVASTQNSPQGAEILELLLLARVRRHHVGLGGVAGGGWWAWWQAAAKVCDGGEQISIRKRLAAVRTLFHSGANSPEGFARSSARLTSRAPHAVIGHSTTPGKVSSIRVAGGSGVGGAAFTGTDTPGGVSEDTMDR